MFRIGAKNFFLAFDGGRAALYHIIEKRGKFVGSLWLGLDSLRWVLKTWGLLRQETELKGFFWFLRTDYSTLELSCLQNQHGRFVELSEYHGGAQRGGIRVPEGFKGKGWDSFAKELASFFLGKELSMEIWAGNSRNGNIFSGLETRDSCAFAAPLKPLIGSNIPFKAADLNLKPTRAPLDTSAPRPTRKYYFKWEPIHTTLRITKIVGEKRQAAWVGLKTKAQGLAQATSRAFPQTHVGVNGPDATGFDPDPLKEARVPPLRPVDSTHGQSLCSLMSDGSDEEPEPTIELNEAAYDGSDLNMAAYDGAEDPDPIFELHEAAHDQSQRDPPSLFFGMG